MFGDVRVVVMGGSASRMLKLAEGAAAALNLDLPPVKNLSDNPDRFSVYGGRILLSPNARTMAKWSSVGAGSRPARCCA